MTQLSPTKAAPSAKPRPNVYTVLIIVAIIALAVTIGIVLNNLMSPVGPDGGYGMSLSDLFSPPESPATPAPK